VYDDSGVAEQAGRWYHVAGSYDGTNLHVYVNGVEVTSAQLNDGGGTTIEPNPSSPFTIGNCGGGRSPWQGAIQDVAFWNGALDAATIAAHASGGTPPPGGGGSGGGGGDGGCDPSDARCVQGGGPTHPLILIPGTLGSYIGTPSGDVLWPDVVGLAMPGDKLEFLAFDDTGHGYGGPMPDKGAGGLITTIAKICLEPLGWPCTTYGGHHYDVTVSKLVDGFGYSYHAPGHETRDQTLFTFPYDWRLSMVANATLLRARIEQVRALTGATSVDILAHSQGGLVTSAYLRQYNGDGVHRVVTAGTPYVGAAKFLTILAFGFPCEIPGCIISPAEASRVARNFPGSLELLPSARYWELLGSPLKIQTTLNGSAFHWTLTHPEMLKWLADNGKNAALDGQAASVHAAVDQFPAFTTPILRIAGTDSWTIGGVEHRVHKRCNPIDCVVTVVDNPRLVSGDGTVPAASAELRNCGNGVNLDTSSNAHSTQRAFVTHDELIRDSTVLAWANTFFRVGASVPPCGDGLSPRRLATAINDGLSGTTLRTVGALTGLIREGTDATGTVDSASGMAVEEIPASAFIPMPGSATYAVSHDGSFQGAFTATADDTVHLEVARYENDVETQLTVTPSLDVAAGAVLDISYAQPQDLGLLQVRVDDDGDGTVDRTVPFEQPLASDAVGDSTPPTSTVTVTHFIGQDGRRMARVVVDAQDTGGAGIGDVAWRTMDGLHGTYTGPFVLPAEGDLQVVASDRAGNEQAEPSWAVLDDRTGLPYRVTEFATRQLHAVGLVDYAGDIDLWGIHSDGGRVRAELAGLSFDASLELDDASGHALATSDEPGNHPEKLDVRVPAGDYLLKVTGAAGAYDTSHSYILNATAPGG
jgi:pimeloyl-ACP methyl ester carboxylesterase